MRKIIDEAVSVSETGWILSAKLLSESDSVEEYDFQVPDRVWLCITTPDYEDTEVEFSLRDIRPLRALFAGLETPSEAGATDG